MTVRKSHLHDDNKQAAHQDSALFRPWPEAAIAAMLCSPPAFSKLCLQIHKLLSTVTIARVGCWYMTIVSILSDSFFIQTPISTIFLLILLESVQEDKIS